MKRTLLLLLVIFQAGCTSWHYRVENNKVTFGVRSWNHDPLDYPVKGADTASFRTLAEGYASDKNHVYYRSDPIEYADPVSFEILKDGYAKDKNHVFLTTYALPGANPATWTLIAEYWSRDANHVYHAFTLVPEAKPETFRYVKDCWAIDDQRAYQHLDFFSAIRSGDDNHGRVKIFEGIDPATFQVIDSFNAKDSRHHYDALGGQSTSAN